jgi:uncharacterized protein YjiS (DUF1127 family)
MEKIMSNEPLYDAFSGRYLVPAEWDFRRQEIVRQARRARAQALRDFLVHGTSRVWTLAVRTGRAVVRWLSVYATWRANRRAVLELQGLPDRTLKDVGIHRSEIESVIYGRDSSRLSEGRIAARLLHKPYLPRTSGKAPSRPQYKRAA